jgi:hypothetical protein
MYTRYAQQTAVPIERSRAEIERLLMRAQAQGFAYMTEGTRAMIGFRYHDLGFKIHLPLPDKDKFSRTPKGRRWRDADGPQIAWEQACRSSWRALCLIVKAKLEAVALGITTVEKEFASDLVLGDGRTLHEHLSHSVMLGKVPKALPFLGEQQVEQADGREQAHAR